MKKQKTLKPKVKFNGEEWEVKAAAGQTLKLQRDCREINVLATACESVDASEEKTEDEDAIQE